MPIREYDLKFEGTHVHCYEGGKGNPILMLHGTDTGPGAGTASMWSRVLGRMARRYHVLAVDLIGFGRSGVKRREPFFDTGMWSRQAQMALDRLAPKGSIGVIGHSLSGYLALRLAANNPRVDKIPATGAMGARFKRTMRSSLPGRCPRMKTVCASFTGLFRRRSLRPPKVLLPLVLP